MSKWATIRLIWLREMRDQFRDRRTMFMVAVLPILLYPLLSLAVFQYVLAQTEMVSVVGIRGASSLPPPSPLAFGSSPAPIASWLTLSGDGGIAGFAGAASLSCAAERFADY